MDSAKLFGKVLRAARLEKKMSQEELALTADVARNFVSLIERGINQPTIQILFRLAGALGIPASKLIKRVEDLERISEKAGLPADSE